jgi:hypothetical protein
MRKNVMRKTIGSLDGSDQRYAPCYTDLSWFFFSTASQEKEKLYRVLYNNLLNTHPMTTRKLFLSCLCLRLRLRARRCTSGALRLLLRNE